MAGIIIPVKAIMVPIGFMIPAPLPIRLHPLDIPIRLTAMFPMTADVPVYSCPICLKTFVAIISVVPIRASDSGGGQC
jgi:hypothetical protein